MVTSVINMTQEYVRDSQHKRSSGEDGERTMNDPFTEGQWGVIMDDALKDPLVLFSFILFLVSMFLVLIAAVWVSPKKKK